MNENPNCFKCGSDKFVIKHHLSYEPEIIVDCCRKCHREIHIRVRKEKSCPYSVKEVRNLSMKSCLSRNQKTIDFYETVAPYVQLSETMSYNTNNGNVYYTSSFSGSKGKKILYIGEK